MQKNWIQYCIKYLSIFFCFYVFANANIFGTISPFLVGFLLALVWCNCCSPFIIFPLYIFVALFTSPSLCTLISVFSTVILLSTVLLFHTKFKKSISTPLFLCYFFLSQFGFVFSQVYFSQEILFTALSVFSSLIFMLVCKKALKKLLFFQNITLPSLTEKICILTVLACLCSGLYNIKLFSIPALQLLMPILILFVLSLTKKIAPTVLFSCICGVGPVISSGNGLFVAPFALLAISSSIVFSFHKIFSVIAIIFTDALCGFFLNLYPSYSETNLIFTTISTFLFLLFPPSQIKTLSTHLFSNQDIALRNVVNRTQENLCKRLSNLGDVFSEMDYVFRNTLKNQTNKAELKSLLINEIREKVCAYCPQANTCQRTYLSQTNSVLNNLVDKALEHGKTTLLDAPAFLTTHCGQVNTLVGAINTLCGQYAFNTSSTKKIDTSKVLIANEMKGLSLLFQKLSKEVGKNISYDTTRENQIISELAFHNLMCADAVIYEENPNTISATLLVRKTDSTNKKIPQVVSQICSCPMSITQIHSNSRAGWDTVILKTSPKLSISFGTAFATKSSSQVSGDTYSIIKISESKFLLALCDGMGSGTDAQKASSLSIGLVENFYKAGFDNEIILSSINQLLTLNNTEIFSTLDICVVDTQTSTADFIKMGAPESFIKHPSTTTQISGGTLPLGIVDMVEPVIKKTIISNQDFIIMFTDGISDSFESTESLQDFINNLSSLTPQTIADSLLSQAQKLSSTTQDDMTIIVAKIFNNN